MRFIKGTALGTAAAIGIVFGAGPVQAQYLGPWAGPPRPDMIESGPIIPPRLVAAILRGQGVRMTDLPARNGDRIIALGIDERGQVMRFVLDARDGAVLRSALVGAPRPPGFIGPDRDILAHAGRVLPDEPLIPPGSPEKPKAKPKAKTAAKPNPTPLPVPAAPAVLPSAANISPAPVAPVTPAPAATAPTVPADPQVRLAPDAQPDIGPKVVPVKPAEVRSADPTPIAAEPAPAPVE